MDNILITLGTRSFAQRIGRLLSSRYGVVYASSEPFPEILLKQHYHRIPTGANPTFAHEALKLCLDSGCQMILPLSKIELQSLQEARVLLAEYGITVLLPYNLEDCFILENPTAPVCVLRSGKDMLTDEQLADTDFSGVGMLSDSGEVPVLCLA